MTTSQEPVIRITTRLPPDVHKWLARESSQNERSMNRQLIYAVRKVINQERENGQDDSKPN